MALSIGVPALGKGKNGGQDKVTVCHVPPGNPENAHEIHVAPTAANNHLKQHEGDSLGSCREPTPTPGLFPALSTSARISPAFGSGPHHIFQPSTPSDASVSFRNQGDDPILVSIQTMRNGDDRREIREVFDRLDFETANLVGVSFECVGECRAEYDIRYAPTRSPGLSPQINDFVLGGGCIERSLGPPGTGCVSGTSGQVCVEQVQGSEVLAPQQNSPYPPLQLELRRCPNGECGPEDPDRRPDLRIFVSREDSNFDEVIEAPCGQPIVWEILTNVEEIVLDTDCIGTNGCGYDCDTPNAFAQWEVCLAPGSWLANP